MKKKRWLIMGAGVGIGAIMLVFIGFSVMADTSGYDVYKAALENNISATSISNEGNIKVADNGEEVLRGEFLAKMDRQQNEKSLAISMDNGAEQQTLNVYKQQDEVIVKHSESDVYRQIQTKDRRWYHHRERFGPPKHMGMVLDTLLGNMEEMTTVENAPNGGKLVSLHLSGDQIPITAKVYLSRVFSNSTNYRLSNRPLITGGTHTFENIKSNLPQLTKNINVEQISLVGAINADQYLERQIGEMLITGTDASGIEHDVVITFDFKFSEFNQTVPDSIDLTGKQVETIQKGKRNVRPGYFRAY